MDLLLAYYFSIALFDWYLIVTAVYCECTPTLNLKRFSHLTKPKKLCETAARWRSYKIQGRAAFLLACLHFPNTPLH